MPLENNIIYLKNNQVDKTKWDACIASADNELIYAYAYYLDTMSRHWDALVLNDYEAVMPLTWNRKYGIFYLYQPFFTASLGIFGKNISAAVTQDFLETIPRKFTYWDIYLNSKNQFPIKGFTFYNRRNYTLNLDKSYEDLFKNFSENHQRNINRAGRTGCIIKKNIEITEVLRMAGEQAKKYSTIKKQDYKNLKNLYQYLFSVNSAETYGVFTANEKLLSACVFFYSQNRAYYILAGNNEAAKKIGASHFLINAFIKEHSNKNLVLDFAGSSIQNIAAFFAKFGANEEIYPGLKRNKLPAILKLFKK